MAANKNYRVVNIEILTSPCRKCSEAICNQTTCAALIAFRARCDQELPSYGVCDFSDEMPAAVKFNYTSQAEYEGDAPAAEADEAPEPSVTEKPTQKPRKKPEPKAKPETAREPEPKVEPVAAEPLIPVDMTLEQIFPPARMAQLTPQKLTQLSLF